MASRVIIIDSSFRRATVTVNPGTYMTDVLEEACKKLNIQPSQYGLKNNNKPIDLSRTFRQTGLTPGAKLELVVASKTPSPVSIALQLPESFASAVPGSRLTDKFPSNTTFWLILRKFESAEGLNLNFTGRGVTEIQNGGSGAGRIYYETPVLNIIGREVSTFGDMQKTLAQLGVNSGSALVRLTFKKTEQPLEEAIAEIGQYFKEEALEAGQETTISESAPKTGLDTDTGTDALTKASSGGAITENKNTTDALNSTPNADTASLPITPSKRPAPASAGESLFGPDGRPISVFSAPSGSTPQAALQPHNDSDFEPTIAHAKLHQSRLQNNSHNKRLLSDAESERLENERAARLAATKEVKIRIRFPDQSLVDAHFTAEQTDVDLYTYVTGVIEAESQHFKLVYTPNKGSGSNTVSKTRRKLIKDLGFSGSQLVNFHWDDDVDIFIRQKPALKPIYRQNAKEVTIPRVAPVESTEEVAPPKDDKGKGKESDGSGGKIKGMPKWFKGLGKK